MHDMAGEISFKTMPDALAVMALKDYLSRLKYIGELKAINIGDEQLFESAFGFTPQSRVEASWYAGGLVFWCEGDDYSEVFINVRSTSVDRARNRAEQSAAVALGPIHFREIGQEVPVALVKYETESKEEYDRLNIPAPLRLDEIDNIHIGYKEKEITKDHIIMLAHEGGGEILHIIDVIADEEYEAHENIYLGKGPAFIHKGPYGILIDRGRVSFKVGEDDRFDNQRLNLTVNRHLNKDGTVRKRYKKSMKPIVVHELQHLLHDLGVPIRLKAERYPRPSSKSQQEIVSAVADFMLKGPLDKSLSNEFLAQAMTDGRKLEMIRRTMTDEVENMGIIYNYLDENLDMARMALAQNREKFDNLAEGTHMVMAETARKYNEFVSKVVSSFEEFESSHTMTREEIVGLLAPHPFHTWPTVLKAVSRHINASKT